MAKYIRGERLKDAILGLSAWRTKVQSQTSQHLFPFLALVNKAKGKRTDVHYEESDDFSFYDTYMKVGGSDKTPYFDPLTRQFRIDTHPHSNVATARKGTFELKWRALTSKQVNGDNFFTFADDMAGILADRAFTRAGEKTKVNILDIASWIYKQAAFPDGADAIALRDRFRSDFQMSDDEFNTLFEFKDEPADHIFASLRLTDDAVRHIVQQTSLPAAPASGAGIKPSKPNIPPTKLLDDDPVLADVLAVMDLGSSGVVFRGAPGTGKSWYAMEIAKYLTANDPSHIFRVQFHPSYGYEDFVEGFVPDQSATSGFGVKEKILLQAIRAAENTDELVVLIVDEINRGDTSRIFGELLTYVDYSWRDIPFKLRLSGEEVQVPQNFMLLATMNPHDRSITQLDMALLRRFDQIDISPSREVATNFLIEAGFEPNNANLIGEWFENLQRLLPFGVGHAFFKGVGDIGALNIMWRYRMFPFCQSILEFEPSKRTDVSRSFEALMERLRVAEA